MTEAAKKKKNSCENQFLRISKNKKNFSRLIVGILIARKMEDSSWLTGTLSRSFPLGWDTCLILYLVTHQTQPMKSQRWWNRKCVFFSIYLCNVVHLISRLS